MRVAVTTSHDRQAEVSLLVSGAGFEPIPLPCIRVSPVDGKRLDEARRAAHRADRIVVSSRRAVETLWPDGGMPDTPVVAVGRQSAAAVAAAGGIATLVGDSDLATLLTRAAQTFPAGLKVLVLHPEDVAPDTSMLQAAGCVVRGAAVYRVDTVAPDPTPEVDAALFGSSSTVEGWRLTRRLAGIVRAAVGKPTADDLARFGAPAHVVADPPSFSDLVDRLKTHIHQDPRSRL